MPYKPTGRPVGRPKTKDYKTISLKIPTTLLDRVQTYARQHRQSLSELIRDGLEWRIGEGDPHGLGMSAPHASMGDKEEYFGNTVIPSQSQGDMEHMAVLQEILTTLALQATQLQALTQAFEQRPVVSTPSEYSGNTTKVPTGQHSTLEPAPEGNGRHAPQEAHRKDSNTVLRENTSTFDSARFVLGPLCQKRHDYDGQGHSLRQRGGKHECVACKNARSRAHKQRQREAKSA